LQLKWFIASLRVLLIDRAMSGDQHLALDYSTTNPIVPELVSFLKS